MCTQFANKLFNKILLFKFNSKLIRKNTLLPKSTPTLSMYLASTPFNYEHYKNSISIFRIFIFN